MDDRDPPEALIVERVLAKARSIESKLRQRAAVLKASRDYGWAVAREYISLQDGQEDDPLLQAAIRNAEKKAKTKKGISH